MDYLDHIKGQLAQKSPLYIKVKILSKMPQTEIVDMMEDSEGNPTYKIRVHAIPVRGAANRELCKFLKKSLSASEVVIVSGGRDKVKLLRITR